jgi:hypothetical protein
MRRSVVRVVVAAGFGAAASVLLAAGVSLAAHPINIPLRDQGGNLIDPTTPGAAPYSSKATCGACHDYDTVTRGYHFQQGWDELYTAQEREEKPWILSPGMAGKW